MGSGFDMIDLPLSINDPVELQILDRGERINCASRVHDMVNGQIQLSWPTRSGIRVPIKETQELLLYFTRFDGIYTGKAVVESVSQSPVPTILVRAAGGMEKVQRREFFRVRTSLPIQLTGIESTPTGAQANKTSGMHLIARTVDISGGGLSIHKEFSIQLGTEFEIKLTLEPDQLPLELSATVVYSEPVKTFQGKQLYRVAMQFVDIGEGSRRRIVRHIFKLQQQMMLRLSDEKPATA